MDDRLANRLFLLGWPLVVVVAGIVGLRGLDGISIALLLVAATVTIPASVFTVRHDCAERENEKALGIPDAHRAVLEKGRTATWLMMIVNSFVAILVWYLLKSYDYRVLLWEFIRVYAAMTVLGFVICVIWWWIERHKHEDNP